MSVEYPFLTKTNFPNQVDRQVEWKDPSAAEIPFINQYNTFVAQGDLIGAIGVLDANPSLYDCIINADKLKQLHHAILAVQRYFYDSVLEKIYRIGNQKGDWDARMSSNAEDEYLRLDKFDVVRYPVDGILQYFLVYNEVSAGEIPTESENYMQISMKGDKGDKGEPGYTPQKGIDYFDGYTPQKGIDYFDGDNGLGFTPCGNWIDNRTYNQYSLVSHNGKLWYALEETTDEEPSDESAIWEEVPISMQSAVGSDIPDNLENGGLWMHVQEDSTDEGDHVVIKTQDSDGSYKELYPETKASYVTDSNGKSLQRWIYQNYFEREDVVVNFVDEDPVFTFTATNINGVVVARYTITDSVATNKQKVHELVAYDEETAEILYYTKTTDTWDGNYKVSSVTEVIK